MPVANLQSFRELLDRAAMALRNGDVEDGLQRVLDAMRLLEEME